MFSRIPWWTWLIAVSFTVWFFVGMIYMPTKLPENLGVSLNFSDRVADVTPGSPGDVAGIKRGDRIVGIEGRPVHGPVQIDSALADTSFDHPVSAVVLRDGQEVHLQVAPTRTQIQGFKSKDYLGWWVENTVSFIQLVVGLVVLFKRPRDLTAVAAGIFLCCLGIGNPFFLGPGGGAVWRSLPSAIQWLIFLPATIGAEALPIPMLLFSMLFPRPLLHRRWAWMLLTVLAVPALSIALTFNYVVLFNAHFLPLASDWLIAVLGISYLTAFLSAIVILVVNYVRLHEINEQRRIRLVVFGLLLFLLNQMAAIAFSMSSKTFWLSNFFSSPLVFGLAQVPFTLCVAYAVLKQRMFQVSFIVRQSMQYAVARGALLIPIPILAGLFIFDLVAHKDQPFATLISQHGWAYVLMGVVGIVAHTKQAQWMNVLDRHFYREHYNAQQLLRQTVDEIRASSNLAEVAPKTVTRIEQSLHPEFVAILVREAGEPFYRCIASAPPNAYPRGLSAESKFMSVFRLFGKPLQISLAESGWLKKQLPAEDTNFLRDARIDLMVPIAIVPHAREAVMVLGPKKSEEPFSSEDQELLSGIGSALALLLERPVTAVLGGFEECPRCGLCYDSGMGHCANEGSQLTRTHFGRLLNSRYRLDRRLGRGGMGTVYKATDTSLERAVAVKLIREDLLASGDAAERFRREAKAIASFTHPNLVTVHDFGVDSETRVFLVMEFLEGSTLRQRIERQKGFPPEQILQVLDGVCAGLGAAHQQNLVHRDLKPENIFLVQSAGKEVAKILDFGLAKFLISTLDGPTATIDTVPGMLVGTPQYMSPNQLNGEGASPAWDIWALAVITYEMLTGLHPFPATSVGQMHYSIVDGRFTPLSVHLPDAPAEWQRFFERALNPTTAGRPQTAREFASALTRAFVLN